MAGDESEYDELPSNLDNCLIIWNVQECRNKTCLTIMSCHPEKNLMPLCLAIFCSILNHSPTQSAFWVINLLGIFTHSYTYKYIYIYNDNKISSISSTASAWMRLFLMLDLITSNVLSRVPLFDWLSPTESRDFCIFLLHIHTYIIYFVNLNFKLFRMVVNGVVIGVYNIGRDGKSDYWCDRDRGATQRRT